MPIHGAPSEPSSASPGLTGSRCSAGVGHQRLRLGLPLDDRVQLAEEFDRGGDGGIDEGGEILEGNGTPDPLGPARGHADAVWIGRPVHDRGHAALGGVPCVGQMGQPGAVHRGEERRRGDADHQHVVVRGRDFEMDVQTPWAGVGEVEGLAVVLTAEIPAAAGAPITFDQAGGQGLGEGLARHEIDGRPAVWGQPSVKGGGGKESVENLLRRRPQYRIRKPPTRRMVFPSGSVTADNFTPLFASTVCPGVRPRPFSWPMWDSRSSTAKLTRAEPARSASMKTCTQPPGTTCHSTRFGIGLLSAGRLKNDSYQDRLLARSVTGTTAKTCSMDNSGSPRLSIPPTG